MTNCLFLYSNCKRLFFLYFIILLPSALFAQATFTFIAERETVAVRDGGGGELLIRAGEYITIGNSRLDASTVTFGQKRGSGFHLLIRFGERSNIHWTFAKYFRPRDTVDVFGDDIFIDYPMDSLASSRQAGGTPIAIGDTDEMWVPYLYRDVLVAQSRDALIDLFPILYFYRDIDSPWYEHTHAGILHGRAMFYNSVIKLGFNTHLAVRYIRRTDFGYIVDSAVSIRDLRLSHVSYAIFPESTFWDQYQPGDAVTLLLYLDNDYLDIYTSRGIYVGTFIRVGREFIAQYQSLIRTNISDLTNVQWPRRAPKELNAGEEARMLANNLQLWENPDMGSAVLSTLDRGSMVSMLEIGEGKTVDGVTAPWVQIQTNAGEIGWVFGLYLREVTNEPMLTAVDSNNADEPVEIAAAVVADSGMPLWVWLAVAGGLAAVGGTVFAVKRKKT